MPVFTVSSQQLPVALRQAAAKRPAAIKRATLESARRLQTAIVVAIDRAKITDTGVLKRSYKVRMISRGQYKAGGGRNDFGGAQVYSDCAYAGVIELGARPHPVGKQVREALAAWAMRKLGLSAAEAQSAAWGIARKIAAEGQKPTYIVRDASKFAAVYLAEALARELTK